MVIVFFSFRYFYCTCIKTLKLITDFLDSVKYMILLGISGITLFAVSAATLALHQEFQEDSFKSAWTSLSLKDKTEVQNSLNCCGFDKTYRKFLDINGTKECSIGHPFCNTTSLRDVSCCNSLFHKVTIKEHNYFYY